LIAGHEHVDNSSDDDGLVSSSESDENESNNDLTISVSNLRLGSVMFPLDLD
jgi:hypothetical protein